MSRNLIISGGIFHPFDESSAALADILAGSDIDSEITTDIDAAVARLAAGDIDLLTINALRWGMKTADKYEPYRAEWAYQAPATTRAGLTDFVRDGGALLALHTASICFDDWPGWGEIVGGRWIWGQSHHPPLAAVSARPTALAHPVTAGLEAFSLVDEVYHALELQPDVEPLLVAESEAGGARQPVCWARRFGTGRVVYDALGHDATSMKHPQHQRLLAQAARWLLEGAVPR